MFTQETATDGSKVSSSAETKEPGEEWGEEQAEEEAADDDEVVEPPKPAREALDPRKQAALRSKIRSDMTLRGRNATAKKARETDQDDEDDEPKRGRSRRGGTKPKASARKPSAKGKAKAKAKVTAKAEPKKRGRQPKARVPPIAEDGTQLALGCSSCRWAEMGCGTCERADFKGKRRSDVSPETIRRAQLSFKRSQPEKAAK